MSHHLLATIYFLLLPTLCASFLAKSPSCSRLPLAYRQTYSNENGVQRAVLPFSLRASPLARQEDSVGDGVYLERRHVLASLAGISTFCTSTAPSNAAAIVDQLQVDPVAAATPNLDCLLDLPPIPKDCVRIFLCRHGQTENNRLRMVQGARVNPPINENGQAMAQRLGMAFQRLDETGIDNKNKRCPSTVMHSELLRAKQTAQLASEQMTKRTKLGTLPSLGEVDFGPLTEGKKVSETKVAMAKTYAAWSAGLIDIRPDGGGDSLNEVLDRAVDSLQNLVKIAANTPENSVVAVSHSAYLRIVLAVLLDIPLAQAAALKLVNGCINVIDVNKIGTTRTLGRTSILFGGPLSQAPKNFELRVPVGEVLRTNENRHLEGLRIT